MGNREDLLSAAKGCLYEKGYARTTARDIATAAGVSLAAIGYHYGSKEALLNAALLQAIEEWGDDLAKVLSGEDTADVDPAERFTATWDKIVESFAATRPLWTVQFELLSHIHRTPELQQAFAATNEQARLALAALFGHDTEMLAVGALYQSLLSGLAAQFLVSPPATPSGAELLTAMRSVIRTVDAT